MTYITKPLLHHPTLTKNQVGYTRRDYEGRISTLCAGCGHDSISAAVIEACWELDIQPHKVAKLSGIGCSSKTPDYFLGASHGFNTTHGRMPSVLSGAALANRELTYLGVSGDGDSASIGIGQFANGVDPKRGKLDGGFGTDAVDLLDGQGPDAGGNVGGGEDGDAVGFVQIRADF